MYSFASYEPLMPLVEKVYFHLELAGGFDTPEHREIMSAWLSSIFPADKLELHWQRVLGIDQWRAFRDKIAGIDYRSIYCQGNDDHVFLGTEIDTFARGLSIIEADDQSNTIFMTSHWPEYIHNSHALGGKLIESQDFAYHEANNVDSIVVLKREHFEWYCLQDVNPNLRNYQGGPLNRIEDWHPVNGGPVFPLTRIYTPVIEQFRHYDGYSHVNMPPYPIAPLEIPPGFFEVDIKIKYGYDQRFDGYVNINPSKTQLKTIDPSNGTDYHWCLSDIPLFWRDRISEIDAPDDIDRQALVVARNQRYQDRARINAHWVFPESWTEHALLPPLTTDTMF